MMGFDKIVTQTVVEDAVRAAMMGVAAAEVVEAVADGETVTIVIHVGSRSKSLLCSQNAIAKHNSTVVITQSKQTNLGAPLAVTLNGTTRKQAKLLPKQKRRVVGMQPLAMLPT